jgi:hypothetical protein
MGRVNNHKEYNYKNYLVYKVKTPVEVDEMRRKNQKSKTPREKKGPAILYRAIQNIIWFGMCFV